MMYINKMYKIILFAVFAVMFVTSILAHEHDHAHDEKTINIGPSQQTYGRLECPNHHGSDSVDPIEARAEDAIRYVVEGRAAYYDSSDSRITERAKECVELAQDKVPEKLHSLKERAGDVLQSAGESIKHGAQKTVALAKQAGHAAKQGAENIAAKATEIADTIVKSYSSARGEVRYKPCIAHVELEEKPIASSISDKQQKEVVVKEVDPPQFCKHDEA